MLSTRAHLSGPLIEAADGWIYFAAGAMSGLLRIPESGGAPEVLTELDREKDEVYHGRPVPLPGGRALVFAAFVGSYDDSHLEVLSLGRESGKSLPMPAFEVSTPRVATWSMEAAPPSTLRPSMSTDSK